MMLRLAMAVAVLVGLVLVVVLGPAHAGQNASYRVKVNFSSSSVSFAANENFVASFKITNTGPSTINKLVVRYQTGPAVHIRRASMNNVITKTYRGLKPGASRTLPVQGKVLTFARKQVTHHLQMTADGLRLRPETKFSFWVNRP